MIQLPCQHSNLTPSCKSCKKLKSEWERKLKKSGLENIEQEDGNLKVWSSHFFKVRYDEAKFKAKEEYYRMASQFLNDFHFQNETDRFIWSQHSEGVSERDIVKMLRVKRKKAYKNGVHKTISALKRLMFLGMGIVNES